jgi:sortase A
MTPVTSRRLLVIAALTVLAPVGLGACSNRTGTGSTTSGSVVTTALSADTLDALSTDTPSSTPAPHANEPIVQLGTIEIPKIGVSASMFEGVSLTVLDHGPGHWPGTAQPGHTGNVVVAGHRTSHSKPFRNIDKLVAGDQVVFVNADGRFVYVVTSTEVVDPTALRILDQTTERTATLFACHPPGSTRQRIVVHLTLSA